MVGMAQGEQRVRRGWRRRAWRVGRLLLIVLVAWSLAVWFLQRQIVFPAHAARPVPAQPPELSRGEVGHIDIADGEGRVEYWFLPGEGVSAARPGPAVLFAHGNAETIDDVRDYVEPLYRPMGISIMLVEYRGYGRSDGTPSEAGLTADFLAAYRLLAERADVDPRRIILHGRSIGTGITAQVAARTAASDGDPPVPAAVILLSPMRSVTHLARRYLVPAFLVRDRFDTEAALRDFPHPVLLLHGTTDSIIPASHSRALAKIIPHSRLVEFDSGHNDVPVWSERFRVVIQGFLEAQGILSR